MPKYISAISDIELVSDGKFILNLNKNVHGTMRLISRYITHITLEFILRNTMDSTITIFMIMHVQNATLNIALYRFAKSSEVIVSSIGIELIESLLTITNVFTKSIITGIAMQRII